jgi:polyisoprenoid-binding protein YceI
MAQMCVIRSPAMSNGFSPDERGGQRVGFSAATQVNRSNFGIDLSIPLDGGGITVSDKVSITLDIEAVLQR